MNTYAYVYTRTRNVDYDVFIKPSSKNIPDCALSEVEAMVEGLIDADGEDTTNHPQYLLVKRTNYLIWGVFVNNSSLDLPDEYKTDKFKRGIRSFIASICIGNMDGVSLPLDTPFFCKVYRDTIIPIWNNVTIPYTEINIHLPKTGRMLQPSYSTIVNGNKDYIRVFNNLEQQETLLSACLGYKGEISIVTNVISSNSLTSTKNYHILNILLSHKQNETPYDDISVTYKCPNCQCEVPYSEIKDGYCDSCRPRIVVEEAEEPEVPLLECKKCHNMFERLTENGYCETCAKKKKYHKYAWIVAIVVFVLLSLKDCEAISHFIPKIDIPSWSYPKDKEVNAPHKKENPNNMGYKNGNDTINKKINQK